MTFSRHAISFLLVFASSPVPKSAEWLPLSFFSFSESMLASIMNDFGSWALTAKPTYAPQLPTAHAGRAGGEVCHSDCVMGQDSGGSGWPCAL